MALRGATIQQIADSLGVSARLVYQWKNTKDGVASALKLGAALADDNVEQSLYSKALGYEKDSVKILMGKDGKPQIIPYREWIAPDTTACIFWLKNRRPGEWRDRIEHSVTASTVQLNLSGSAAEHFAQRMLEKTAGQTTIDAPVEPE